MAEKKTKPRAESEGEGEDDVLFTPDPSFDSQVAETGEARYQVLSSGISTPVGPFYQGEVIDAAIIGDAARIAKLLDAKAIKAV